MTYDNGGMIINAGFALGFALAIWAILIVYLIAWCKLFKKAGLPWERMFVPFYSTYWMCKLAGYAWMFWANLIVGVGGSILVASFVNFPPIALALSSVQFLTILVFYCMYCAGLAKAFGKRGGFVVGLILLHSIFIAILGFGSASYVSFPKMEGEREFWDAWKCPSCGTLNKGDRTHCRECGEEK